MRVIRSGHFDALANHQNSSVGSFTEYTNLTWMPSAISLGDQVILRRCSLRGMELES